MSQVEEAVNATMDRSWLAFALIMLCYAGEVLLIAGQMELLNAHNNSHY